MISRLSIRWKVFILCIGSISISSLILVLSLSSILGQQAYNKVVGLSKVTVSQYAENIQRQLLTYQYSIQALAEYKPLQLYMEIDDPHEALNYYLNQIHPTINNMFSRQYSRLRIYTNNMGYEYASEFKHSLKDEQDKLWYQKIVNGENQFWLDEPSSLGLYSSIASYYHAIHTTNGTLRYVVATYVSGSVFDSWFSKEIPGNKHFLVMDKENKLLYSDQGISEADAMKFTDGDQEDGEIVHVDDEEYILLTTSIDSGDLTGIRWKLFCLVPYSDVMEERDRAIGSSMMITCGCVIIACLFSLSLSSSISRKASRLLNKINQLKAGNFDIVEASKEDEKPTSDELSILDRDFDYMAKRIHDLINQVYYSELEAKEEQIKIQQLLVERTRSELFSLQRQIAPHYLFNTLEAIRMRLLLNGDNETAEIVELFGKSFHARVYYHGEKVALREELELVREYITICNFRFNGRLTLEMDVNDDEMDISIPKLIIQPLVENAITHGIEDSPNEDATILLEVRIDNGAVCIRVSDNGMGMPEERLVWVQRRIEVIGDADVGESIGIQNVSRRLKLMYGEAASMSIDSVLGMGTTVEMVFPISDRSDINESSSDR